MPMSESRLQYEQTIAGFEMRHKLPIRIGWVIFGAGVQSQMGPPESD